MMELRPYQTEAQLAIEREWAKGNRRTLMVLPTGTGKTIVFCALASDAVRNGQRVLILAHRGELLDQAADKLARATGLGCSVEKADQTCFGSYYRVVVGSVQTLMQPQRLAQFPPDYFGVIIIDEAHHALADSYQRVLSHFDGANVLGVTATPDRGDMKNLGEFFDSLAYEYTLPQAIRDGFLCPIRAQTIPLEIDLTGVGTRAGDFVAGEVGTALDPYLAQIADEMDKHCRGRKTVVFLPLIATSEKFAAMLQVRGFSVAEVHGTSTDRSEVLDGFQRGDYDVLCNSMLLTEGWDCPHVDCIVCLRPTQVRSLYCQIIGRGTRTCPNKSHLLLLDFLWLSTRHELCRPAHLIAESDEVAEAMVANMATAEGPVDLQDAEKAAEGDAIAAREEALAKKLEEMRHRKRKLVDPLQYEMSIGAEDLAGYVPAFGWEAQAPNEAQRERLERAGLFADEIENAGKAELLLERLDQRRADGLTTPKQIRFLESRGFRHVGQWEFEAARRLIDRIAGNSWRTPPGIVPEAYVPKSKQPQQSDLLNV